MSTFTSPSLQLLTSNPFSARDNESWEVERQQFYGQIQLLQKQLWEETSARIEAQVGYGAWRGRRVGCWGLVCPVSSSNCNNASMQKLSVLNSLNSLWGARCIHLGCCLVDVVARTTHRGHKHYLHSSPPIYVYTRLALTHAPSLPSSPLTLPHTLPSLTLPHTLPSHSLTRSSPHTSLHPPLLFPPFPPDPSRAPPQAKQRADGAHAEDARKGPSHPGRLHLP